MPPPPQPHGGIDHRGGTRNEQHPEPFITGPADAAHWLFATGRTFLRREARPCGEMAPGFEHRRVDFDGKRQRGNRAHARDGDQTLADVAGFMRGLTCQCPRQVAP